MVVAHRTRAESAWISAYVAALTIAAVVSGIALGKLHARPPGHASSFALPILAGLVVAAEYLFVRFRFLGQVNALNLVEAALAPLVWAYAGPVVVITVAVAQLIAEALRRNDPIKAAFNIAQWCLAAAAGSAVIVLVGQGHRGIDWVTVGAVAASQAAIALVNHICFTCVVSIANRKSPLGILRASVFIPAWFIPWILNALIGMLFVLAYQASPLGAILFPIPLVVLHLAYRGYAGARTDRVRLAGLHQAAQSLAEPLDPHLAIHTFLSEVARSFEAQAAAIVLSEEARLNLYRYDVTGQQYTVEEAGPVETTLMTIKNAVRVTERSSHPAVAALASSPWRDCLVAPLIQSGVTSGLLVVYDQTGLEGFEAGELALIEALARETASTLSKGRLIKTVIEERRTFADIVGSTSDGIFTVGVDGRIMSWNPAMERITGVPAAHVVLQEDGGSLLRLKTADGSSAHVCKWHASPDPLPQDLLVVTADGSSRHVSCSYSTIGNAQGPHTLVAIMRDVTQHEEMAVLLERYGRLAEAEATQRAVVEQLQAAVMPPRPLVDGLDLGVSYLSSDPSAPTGGDLYDAHVLPSGDLHLAVVDVLGHGVAATRDALAVVHTLRLLALQGCPLEKMVISADGLLAQENRDLVATVVVARHNPKTGRTRLVSGGHPPPLLISAETGLVSQISLSGGPIGWPNAGTQTVSEVQLEPGDSLVFYTDGLIESKRNIIEGMSSLMRHAHELRYLSADGFAAQLLHRALAEADRRDDSLTLVLRQTPVPTKPDHASWRIGPDRERAHAIRRELAGWLATVGISQSVSADVELIVAELLANAVVAGRTRITLGAWKEPGVLLLEVEDDGTGRSDLGKLGAEQADPSQESGRGLFIVRSIADEVTILSTAEGTIVRCTKRLPSTEAAALPQGTQKISDLNV